MKKVFVSHIHDEADLASKLKDWIEDSFLGQCKVFVSSDPRSLAPGARWLEEIDEALSSASAFIVLCSPASIRQPWVNFETGAGWVKEVPLVPVCHSGLTRSSLPLPLSAFQAIELEAPDFADSLLEALSRHLDFPRAPRVDASAMQKELLAQVERVVASEPSSHDPPDDVAPECLEILVALAGMGVPPTAAVLAHRFDVGEQKMRYFLDLLIDGDLIDRHLYIGSAATYYLTREGRRFLVDRGRL